MTEFSTFGLPTLMHFLEHSENIILIQADEYGRIINCNLTLMRFLRKDERPIGALVEDTFLDPNGNLIELCDQVSDDAPIPQIVKLKGSLLLFKLMCWRYNSGMLILAERIEGGDELVLQTMSSLTNEVVNISRELAKKTGN